MGREGFMGRYNGEGPFKNKWIRILPSSWAVDVGVAGCMAYVYQDIIYPDEFNRLEIVIPSINMKCLFMIYASTAMICHD